MTHRRLFFALWPDADVCAKLHQCAGHAHQRLGGRLMRADTLHLTLAFLGKVEEARVPVLQSLLQGRAWPLGTLLLDRLGHFRGPRIVWAGPDRAVPWLTQLHDALLAALTDRGFVLPDARFRPHVSLLRDVDRADPDCLKLAEPVFWPVRHIVLVQSMPRASGSYYQWLEPPLLHTPAEPG